MLERGTEAIVHKDEAIKSITAQVFQLFFNLVMEEARRPWCEILGEQIDVSRWNDSFGVEHTKKHKMSWSIFMDCMTLHFLSVFQSEGAETQQFYNSNRLKKPNRVPIRQFVQRIEQLGECKVIGISSLFPLK